MNRFCFNTLLLAVSLSSILLHGCGREADDQQTIRVGTIAGPETRLMEAARDVAREKYDLNVVIVEFSEYTIPNAALNEGSIDANAFQHQPYLDAAIQANNYNLTAIGKTFIYPIGVYSNTVTDLSELKNNAIVAIPNDPSNEARALLLLEQAGLIKLDPNAGHTATPSNITENPKNLRFREIDAAQLPRVLRDVDIAVINSNYAVSAGLKPSDSAIYLENKDSDYANLIVVRSADKDNEQLNQLVKAYQSRPVLNEANDLFQGEAIPAW